MLISGLVLPQWCWQSWQRARCHCLLTVDGIIQVLTIPTLLTLHHITTIHYRHLLLTSKIRYTLATFGHLTRQEVIVQPTVCTTQWNKIQSCYTSCFSTFINQIWPEYEQNGWGVFRVNNEIFIWTGNSTFDVGCCNTPIAAHSKERSIPRSAAPDVTVCSAGWAGHVRPTWQIKSIIHRHEYYQFLALDKVYNCIR